MPEHIQKIKSRKIFLSINFNIITLIELRTIICMKNRILINELKNTLNALLVLNLNKTNILIQFKIIFFFLIEILLNYGLFLKNCGAVGFEEHPLVENGIFRGDLTTGWLTAIDGWLASVAISSVIFCWANLMCHQMKYGIAVGGKLEIKFALIVLCRTMIYHLKATKKHINF